MRFFGCTAYAHIDNGKLEPRAIKCVFVGYGSGVKGYKLWDPETNKVFMSRSVVFNEFVMYHDDLSIGTFDEQPQRVTVQVEQLDEEENVIVDNDDFAPDAQVDDNVDGAPDT